MLWMNLRGQVLVQGKPAPVRFNPGVTRQRFYDGISYNFFGPKSGILIPDLPALRLTGSMTVSAWVNPRNFVKDGDGAEILFRGDDRNGMDPYWFVIEGDGTINFGVSNEEGRGMKIKAELPLHKWSHVTANFDVETGDMNMWINGERVAYARTAHHPYATLQVPFTPGVGIGNVQNDHGPHNQPFDGYLADLRLYNVTVTPDRAGFTGFIPRDEPPMAKN